MCNMEHFSQHFRDLSTASKERYEQKVTSTGLKHVPYIIKDWCENLASLPDVQWSDLVVYMTSTPSQFTREAIKVRNCIFQCFDAK